MGKFGCFQIAKTTSSPPLREGIYTTFGVLVFFAPLIAKATLTPRPYKGALFVVPFAIKGALGLDRFKENYLTLTEKTLV